MTQPYFSIVVPAYNAEDRIKGLIRSIKELSFRDFECVIVNDGSQDLTESIVMKEIQDDMRFQLITTKNQGPGSARTTGVKATNGKYLVFFDVDDQFSVTVLEDYHALLIEKGEVDLIISSFQIDTYAQEKKLSDKKYLLEGSEYLSNTAFVEDIYNLMNQQFLYVCWNKCYRLDIIKENQIEFPPYQSCEDRLFNLAFFKFCESVITIPIISYFYHFDGQEGITNKYHANKFETFKEFYLVTNQVTNNKNKDGTASLYLKGVTSVIFSVQGTDQLSLKTKWKQINLILSDETVKEAKKIMRLDSSAKKMTKLIFSTPKFIVFSATAVGSFIERRLPGVMSVIKRKY